MDSYSFHFERMSNVDLHPLSLPVSRLSPAKSNSSIVDQLSHHQHGKGDSAYSSFSGGSTAPDYPSPFLPEDMQSSTFCHYADNKYLKTIYQPTQVLQSDSKTMDQLYRSVEAISQQYRNNTNSIVNPPIYNNNNVSQPNSKNLLKPEVPLGTSSQSACPSIRPPPVPARQDSFIATKNLENSRGFQHSTEINFQQPQLQQQSGFFNRVNPQPQTLNASRIETANPSKSNLIFNSDPVYSVWKGPQQPQQQTRQQSSYKPRDQNRVSMNPEYLSIADNKVTSEQQKSANTLSRSLPRGTNQTEPYLRNKPLSSDSECIGDNQNKAGNSSHFESQRKRANSMNDWLGSEPTRASSPWNAGQSFVNSSIQHKGQFYFVTGVCKQPDSNMRTHSLSVCGSESCAEISTLLESHRLSEKERSHSTMDKLFQPLQDSSRSSSCTITDEREDFTSLSLEDDLISKDQENYQPSLSLPQSLQSFNTFDQNENREIGRHTSHNPIFYCGPGRNSSTLTSTQTMEVTSLVDNKERNHHKREDLTKGGKRQPLGDVACERINKETTPLLYHLTGANRTSFKPRKELGQENSTITDTRCPPDELNRNNRVELACNTLDDSFKKYYKEKLKDAQSKVLRETSFKRRDLQLSWPHNVRQNPEPRLSAIHSVSSSLDSEFSIDTLIPSVTSEETESIKENDFEYNDKTYRWMEREMGRSTKVAQPQVVRIRGRKRLTAEQKKMCYSEPEKLNQLGSDPNQTMCRSFSNGSETLLAGESEGDDQLQNEEQGFVAARRKIFERRGRALSASSDSKTNLKHLQHKALVEYMERKTGQKVAEPQQPAPQTPLPPRQRHSLGEKPFDWGPRPLSGNVESRIIKRKLHRPHSAGRILDSSTSSMRYAQFFSAQSCSGQFAGQQNQIRQRESQGPAQVKSASAETLLDQPEPPSFFRNRSTSTPHAFEVAAYEEEPLPVNTMETQRYVLVPQTNWDTFNGFSSCRSPIMEPPITLVPEGQQPVRVAGLRGKSMEDLGTSKVTKISALSKSSEQLDQLWRYSTESGKPDREKKRDLFSDQVGKAKGQDKIRKKQYETQKLAKEIDVAAPNNPQVQTQNHTLKNPLHKNNCEPEAETTTGKSSLSRSISPISSSSPRARGHSALPESDDVNSNRQPSETSLNPPSPRRLEVGEREVVSMVSSPGENRPNPRVQSSSLPKLGNEQSVDEPGDDSPAPDSTLQVSLNCGIPTDRSLWILQPNEELKQEVQTSPVTNSVFDESTSSASSKQTKENLVSPCLSTPDTDNSQIVGNGKYSETEDEKKGETLVMEERGTPEGETDSMKTPVERPLWEELVKTIVKADQSLARVLYPLANRKTAMMLMEQLLSEDTLLMEEHYKKKQEQKISAESSDVIEGPEPTSECASEGPDLESKDVIAEKKHLLVSYINERLHSLEETRSVLQLDVDENAARGEALVVLVRERCQPVELERYNLFIGDLERVVSLLLCLSARLARVQNALSTVGQDTDAEEKQSLDSRHRLLCKQREDAKDLKDNLDRRENLVSTFLSRQLSAEQLQGYRRFVQTKASLLIQQKDLEEKQRLAEEQLEALSNSLKL